MPLSSMNEISLVQIKQKTNITDMLTNYCSPSWSLLKLNLLSFNHLFSKRYKPVLTTYVIIRRLVLIKQSAITSHGADKIHTWYRGKYILINELFQPHGPCFNRYKLCHGSVPWLITEPSVCIHFVYSI